ncbi:MAG: hypothetical protein MJ180_03810 [Candidatus Gastranaerophilales bacterium]|nr:hypothetical protein [Candidatus Gastranaerophilales bacterium]
MKIDNISFSGNFFVTSKAIRSLKRRGKLDSFTNMVQKYAGVSAFNNPNINKQQEIIIADSQDNVFMSICKAFKIEVQKI